MFVNTLVGSNRQRVVVYMCTYWVSVATVVPRNNGTNFVYMNKLQDEYFLYLILDVIIFVAS